MSSLMLHALGARLRVTLADHGLATRFREVWARCLVPSEDDAVEAEPLTISVNGQQTVEMALVEATQAITHRLIAAQTGRLLMFHAGAAAHPVSGKTVVFVAPGGTGKTTLAIRLCARLGYVTDETVALDRQGQIYPYPKPLSMRLPGSHKIERSPDLLGLGLVRRRPTIAKLVLLCRDGDCYAEELSIADMVFGITPETSSVNKLDRPLQWLASLHETLGPIVRYHYAEADDLVDVLEAGLA